MPLIIICGSTDRRYQLGDKVAILTSDAGGAKLYNRGYGPATIVEVNSPYSYIVELGGRETAYACKQNEKVQ